MASGQMDERTNARGERPLGLSEVQITDDDVRVTRWSLAPGAETGRHHHDHDYIVVPLTTGALTIQNDESTVRFDLVAGVSYNRRAGVEHNVMNDNDFEMAFVEIELLRASSGPRLT